MVPRVDEVSGAERTSWCVVCGGGPLDVILRVADDRHAPENHFDLVRCPTCGVEATHENGALVDPAGHYPETYGAFGEHRPRRRRDRAVGHVAFGRMAWLAELADAPAVLDVGSGSGRLLRALVDAGHEATGVEPSPSAVAKAREAGFTVIEGTIDDVEGESCFDAIILTHVLEHVMDPGAALIEARRLLAPGGVLVLSLPNAGCVERHVFGPHWDGFDVPRHVHHFGPENLDEFLRRSGWRVRSRRFEVYALLGRSARNAGWAPWIVRILGIADKPVGLLLAILRRSGAMQLIVEPRAEAA